MRSGRTAESVEQRLPASVGRANRPPSADLPPARASHAPVKEPLSRGVGYDGGDEGGDRQAAGDQGHEVNAPRQRLRRLGHRIV